MDTSVALNAPGPRSGPGFARRTATRRLADRWRAADAETIVTGVVFTITSLFVFAPVAFLFYGSFRTDSPGAPDATFTLANWAQVYTDPSYQRAILNTVLLSGAVGVLSLVVGTALAWIIARTNAPGRHRLAILVTVPLMISGLVTTLAWIGLAAPNAGFINATARSLIGVRRIFDIYSFTGITLVLVLHYASFAFIPIYGALRSIDSSLEEASYMLGAGPLRTALRMTLPLIWPSLVSTFLLIFVFVAENFSVPTLLGANFGFRTLASWVYYEMAVEPANPPRAAAAGMMLLWIAVVGTIWQRRIVTQSGRYVTIAGKGARNRVSDLGPWKYVASGFVWLYLFLAVLLPYATLVFGSFLRFITPRIHSGLFTTQNYAKLTASGSLLPIENSLMLSAGSAVFATVAYVFIAYLIKRSRGWSGRFMDYVALVPTTIPALALAIGFVWAYIRSPVPIYGTIWILFFAYFTRFFGQGIRQSRVAFVQISDELAEAARIAGASPLRSFRDILFPLLRPSLLSLATILFILIFMEISMTIILYTPKTKTVAVLLWESMAAGNLTGAFAVAVLQATIVLLVLWVSNLLFGTLRATLDR